MDHTATRVTSDKDSASPTQTPQQNRLTFPPAYILDALIDDHAYHLPSPEEPPISILLLDGTFAQLFSNKVIMRGQTLTIPSGLSDVQEITSGGQSIRAQPGESKQPDSSGGGESGGGGGGGGGNAIGSLLGGLAGAAGKAVGSLADAGKGAMELASGTGGAAAGGLASTFSTAAGDVGGLVSSLNGIQKAFPADQLTKAGLGAAMGALNLGRDSSNWLTSMGNMVKGFDGLTPEVQQQARENMKQYAGPEGPLQKASEAMKAFEDFPWESETPITQSPTASATGSISSATQTTDTTAIQSSQEPSSTSNQATTTQAPTRTTTDSSIASSSSTTASDHEKPTQYFIRTKEGTSLDTFNEFIQGLDGGVGRADTYDPAIIPYQSYLTILMPSQVKDLEKKHDFLLLVHPCVFNPADLESTEEFLALPQQQFGKLGISGELTRSQSSNSQNLASSKVNILPRALLPADRDAPYWKKMISSPFRDPPRPPTQDPPFVADDSGGRGTTVYIIDDGFDIGFDDLAATDRAVETFVVPNRFTFPGNFLANIRPMRPNAAILDEDITRGVHGTKMAIIAAGRTHGVAPNANLYLIKAKGAYLNEANDAPDKFKTYAYQIQAVDRALTQIRSEIQMRRNAGSAARSVINMSWGVPVSGNGAGMEGPFREFFEWCERAKVPVTIAAGNDPGTTLDETVPQKFGTQTNTLITVGGVDKNGKLYRDTSLPRQGQPGHMTVFAPAVDIVVPGKEGIGDTGTSQAAAIVAGIAAYFYSVPNLGITHEPGFPSPAENMKEFIVGHAWTRVRSPLPDDQPFVEWDVVYNLGHGDPAHPETPCIIEFGKRAAENISACSVTSSAGSSTTASRTPTQELSKPSALPVTSTPPPATVTTTFIPSSAISRHTPIPPAAPTPASEKCRINVIEFDNPDPNNHDEQVWSISIFPMTTNALIDNTQICFHGTDANEQTGADVECPPIGEGDKGVLNVRRETGDLLRFIWGSETWTVKDERCKLVQDWHQSDIDREERKRETDCVFECKIDWTKPPSLVLD